MSDLWRSLGQKRTIAIKYEPNPTIIQYLVDMREATRMALAYGLVDARLNAGTVPSPVRLRKKVRPWFVSSMPYAPPHQSRLQQGRDAAEGVSASVQRAAWTKTGTKAGQPGHTPSWDAPLPTTVLGE